MQDILCYKKQQQHVFKMIQIIIGIKDRKVAEPIISIILLDVILQSTAVSTCAKLLQAIDPQNCRRPFS